MSTIASTAAHELEDALADLEREYLYGNIGREEWSDRRDAHLAWFAERGIDDDPADAGD